MTSPPSPSTASDTSGPAVPDPPGRREWDESGMSTAEYAIGTLAACGFAGVLWVVVHSGAVHGLLQSVITRALNLAP